MRHTSRLRTPALGLVTLTLLLGARLVEAENWPGWRGPRGDGSSLEENPPVAWKLPEDLAWKAPVPGQGHSSPVVWGDRVFLTTAIPETQARLLLCFDRGTGALLWKQTVVEAPLEAKNNENSYASATPATDGERVYVSFLDGYDVVVSAYTLGGDREWQVRPGRFKSQWGFSHVPVLFEDSVILVCFSKGENFLVALNRNDGHTRWKTVAEVPTQSYSAPLIREMAGREQLIAPGNKAVTSYDPRTGKVLWVVEGLADDSVATPVYHEKTGLVLTCTSWPQKVLRAIRPDGAGNVSTSHVAWRTTEGAPYVPSPVAAGEWFFTSSYAGRSAYCFDAATGDVLWKEPMGLHHASPVTAKGMVFFLNDDGVMHVVRAGPRFELLARNELGEPAYASPAFNGGHLLVRGFQHLYCIGPSASQNP